MSKVTCELQAMKIYTKQVATKHPHDIPEPAWDNTLKQAERIAGIVGRQAEAHLKEQGDTPSLAHLSKWVVEAQAEINRHQAQINSPVSFRDREAEHKHLFEERYGMEAKGAMCQSINKKAARQDYLTSFYMDSQGLSPDRSYWIAFNEAEAGSRLDNTSGVIDRRQCEQGRKQYYDNMECILQVWAKEHQRDLQKERQAHHSEREREHQQTELQRTLEQDKNRDRGFER